MRKNAKSPKDSVFSIFPVLYYSLIISGLVIPGFQLLIKGLEGAVGECSPSNIASAALSKIGEFFLATV